MRKLPILNLLLLPFPLISAKPISGISVAEQHPTSFQSSAALPDSIRSGPHRFFNSYGTAIFTEFMTSGAIPTYVYANGGYSSNGTLLLDRAPSYQIASCITLMSITYEFRKNIRDVDDHRSFSMSAPLALSVNFIDLSERMGTLVVPVFTDFNIGMHSTYNNISRYGAHFGVGYQVVIGGLKMINDANRMGMLAWAQPVARLGVKFPMRMKNAKQGIISGKYVVKNCFIDGYFGLFRKYEIPQTLDYYTKEETYKTGTAKIYFKIDFGCLINY